MDVTLAGTGGPEGFPRPGCPCSTCRAEHEARRPTSVLVTGPPAGGHTDIPVLRPGDPVPPGAAYAVALAECADERIADTLAAARRAGRVTPTTRVVAIGIDHGLGRSWRHTLPLWGVEVLPDGARVDGEANRADPPRRVLVLGGARSGKSVEAERRLRATPVVTYVATSDPAYDDAEWAARVATHRARRPAAWRTVETLDLAELLQDPPPGSLLVDCLTLWLAARLDDPDAADRLVAAWRAFRGDVVAVTNEVGGGVVPATESGRRFRDALGVLNARIAAESDEVWHVVAGVPRRLA